MSDQPPFIPARPPTPQSMLHRMPDKPDPSSEPLTRPSKHIILIIASTAVAGKVHIAKEVSKALACPLFQGDSMHESASKAASVGAPAGGAPNDARYRRMWLSRMTRTGLLFPDESRPATEGFSGFGGGGGSTSTSRRGSASSVASMASGASLASGSQAAGSTMSAAASASGGGDVASGFLSSGPRATQGMNNPVFTVPEQERQRKSNPALLVVTHPVLEGWHKAAIREAVGEYGIGVIFVPLDEDEEAPVLRPLDPKTMTSFGSFAEMGRASQSRGASLEEENYLRVDWEGRVEDIVEEIVDGARDMMGVS